MLKNLLLYRLAIFNILMVALLGYIGYEGWIAMALAADPTGICAIIALIFAVTFGSSANQAWGTAKGLNFMKGLTDRQRRVPPEGKPWTKRMVKIEHIHAAAGWMAYIGLIGTMIGFLLALGAIDPASMATAAGVNALVPKMMASMGVAIWTTLTGAFFGFWTEVNHMMIRTATHCLAEDEKATWDA